MIFLAMISMRILLPSWQCRELPNTEDIEAAFSHLADSSDTPAELDDDFVSFMTKRIRTLWAGLRSEVVWREQEQEQVRIAEEERVRAEQEQVRIAEEARVQAEQEQVRTR